MLGIDGVLLPIERRVAAAALDQLGGTVLVYERTQEGVSYFARARVISLEAEDGQYRCRLVDVSLFDPVFVGQADGLLLGARRMLALSDERFAELLRLSEQAVRIAPAAEARVVEPWAVNFSLVELHDEVLRRWDYRCAITDIQFAPEGRPHPSLRLVPIRPRELGGTYTVDNILPMVEFAEHAWRSGAIGVGANLELLAVLDRLPPDLLTAMPRDGRLIVPEDRLLRPNPENLAYHRMHVFGS